MRFSWARILPFAVPAALLVCGITVGEVPDDGQPGLVVEAESVDLGEIVRGQDAVGRFVFRNTGSAVLEILHAKPG